MFMLFGGVTKLCPHTNGPRELVDSASIAVKPPPPRFRCRYYTSSTSSQMANMGTCPPCLLAISMAAVWRNRHIPSKKWQCPCGKVVTTMPALESKVFGIHCSGAQHMDWVWYGKVVPELF